MYPRGWKWAYGFIFLFPFFSLHYVLQFLYLTCLGSLLCELVLPVKCWFGPSLALYLKVKWVVGSNMFQVLKITAENRLVSLQVGAQ